MWLELQREQPTSLSTPGAITSNGAYESYSLERPPTDPDHPCIQAGTYELTLRPTYNAHLWTPYGGRSDGLKVPADHPLYRVLPHIENVPGHEGILMHAGNTAQDTSGCVLCGYDRTDPDHIARSRVAVKGLVDELAARGGRHQIVVKDAE